MQLFNLQRLKCVLGFSVCLIVQVVVCTRSFNKGFYYYCEMSEN